jgi:hypothetical protein
VPVDVDLEDRLFYGLTPIRLGYVVGLLLLATVVFRSDAWIGLRILGVVVLAATAIVAGWVRYEGRHADRWITDAAMYALANYTLAVTVTLPALPALPRRARKRDEVQLGLFDP